MESLLRNNSFLDVDWGIERRVAISSDGSSVVVGESDSVFCGQGNLMATLLLFISSSDADFSALTAEMTAKLCPGGGRVRVFGVADAGAMSGVTTGGYS